MITFQNVTRAFGPHTVLDRVKFQIDAGEFVLLTGPSGSGKTTVVNLLIGADRPNSGMVEVDGLAVNEMSPATLQLYRRRVGVVFQDYKLLPAKTVFENVAFALEACGEDDAFIAHRVPEVLQKVGLLPLQDHFPDQLSGGERQRLSLARALVHAPRLIIADEPTGNLDEDNVRSLIDLLKTLHREGATVLMTTHDPLVRSLAEARTLTLKNGIIL